MNKEEITAKQILSGILLVVLLVGGYIIADLSRTTILNLPKDAIVAFECRVGVEGNPCDTAYAEGFRWGLAQIPLQVGIDTANFCASRFNTISADPNKDCYSVYERELALQAWKYLKEFDENYYIHGGGLYPSKQNYPLSFGKNE